jgi:hypothetical protein
MPRNVRVVVDDTGPEAASYRLSAASGPHVVLERKWFTPATLGLAVFCVLWDSFIVFWYAMAFHGGGGGNPISLLFPIVHVGAGVALTYTALCGFVNRTRISVENGMLTVRHGPLPWPGNRTIATSDVRQLFCAERVGNKGSRSYSLNAMLATGPAVPLLKNLNEPDQALYIEQILEKRLGIVDVPVAGEYT